MNDPKQLKATTTKTNNETLQQKTTVEGTRSEGYQRDTTSRQNINKKPTQTEKKNENEFTRKANDNNDEEVMENPHLLQGTKSRRQKNDCHNQKHMRPRTKTNL